MVALKEAAAVVEAAIEEKISPDKLYTIEQGKWIIDSEAITAKDVSDHLGLIGTTSHLIVGIRGYYGRAQPDLREWPAAKSAKG